MPNNNRQAIRKCVDQVFQKVEKSQNELVGIANVFHDTHMDYFNSAMWLASKLEEINKGVKSFYDAI